MYFYILSHLILLTTVRKWSIISILISSLKQQKHRKIEQLALDYAAIEWCTWERKSGRGTPEAARAALWSPESSKKVEKDHIYKKEGRKGKSMMEEDKGERVGEL